MFRRQLKVQSCHQLKIDYYNSKRFNTSLMVTTRIKLITEIYKEKSKKYHNKKLQNHKETAKEERKREVKNRKLNFIQKNE